MTVKELKHLIADMADDARVFARDRDCISLRQVDIVNHPTIPLTADIRGVHFHDDIKTVYGGSDAERDLGESKQAIIFCDCD